MFRMPWPAPIIAAGIVTCLSASCSAPAADGPVTDGMSGAKQFSEDDRRAARALSIGNVRTVAMTDNPLDQAVLCSLAIGEIAERMQTSGMGLTQEQIEAVIMAKKIYDRRAIAAARTKPADAIQTARARIAEANPEPSARAQTAIACLRQLA